MARIHFSCTFLNGVELEVRNCKAHVLEKHLFSNSERLENKLLVKVKVFTSE